MKIVHYSDGSSYEIGYNSRGYWITRASHQEFLEGNPKPSFKSGRKLFRVAFVEGKSA